MVNDARSRGTTPSPSGKQHRNGQATVLAPTGTIGFMMDYDTTGIEADIAPHRNASAFVGGGMIKIVNNTTTEAPRARLRVQRLIAIQGHPSSTSSTEEPIEGAPHLKDEHLAVFDCAFRAANGTRSIDFKGHIRA